MGTDGTIRMGVSIETILWVMIMMLIFIILIVLICKLSAMMTGNLDGNSVFSNMVCIIATVMIAIIALAVILWIDKHTDYKVKQC